MVTPLQSLMIELEHESPAWYAQFLGYNNQLRHWIENGMIPNPQGRIVWDLGCGWAAFSLAFLAQGAKGVVATDTFLDRSQIPVALFSTGLIDFRQCAADSLSTEVFPLSELAPSLVFMHLMTEHVDDLPSLFSSIRAQCSTNTKLFIHHDNYYHPVGHHDHGFLMLDAEKHAITSLATPCWTSLSGCISSEKHRAQLSRERVWQWGDVSDSTRDPSNCQNCNYRIRAQPWAHLIAANNFASVWPEAFFTDALNKITPFQLRQYLIEAGYQIDSEVRNELNNKVPQELLHQFTDSDLRTFTITIVASIHM
jgi:hypothetical protein